MSKSSSNFDKLILKMVCYEYYGIVAFSCLWCAYRFYWSKEDFRIFEFEHLAVVFWFGSLNFLSVWSHFQCWTADPGFVKQHHFEGVQAERCQICDVKKVETVHHCSTCDGCIFQMDHHCVWVGNCLGRGTSKYFFLFTFYSFLSTFFGWLYFIFKVENLTLNIVK